VTVLNPCTGFAAISEVAMAVGEIIAAHSVLVLEMADDGLDGGAAFRAARQVEKSIASLPETGSAPHHREIAGNLNARFNLQLLSFYPFPRNSCKEPDKSCDEGA
jgi:hypothetical protein